MNFKRTPGDGRKSLESLLKESDELEGRIGWDKSAVYPNGIPVAEGAATQEYGDPAHNIPQRSFMRTTIQEKQSEWKESTFKLAKSVLNGSETMKGGFTKVVLKAEGDIAEKITTIQDPPLKESTIQARLNRRKDKQTVGNLTKPLVDTGYMLATLASVVK